MSGVSSNSSTNPEYWYNNMGGSSGYGKPAQAIPTSKKTKEWSKANLDFFEWEAVSQYRENRKYIDIDRMMQGKMSHVEALSVMPHLDENTITDNDIPKWYRHYDLIGVPIRVMQGELSQQPNNFHARNEDEFFENDFIREQSRRQQGMLKEMFQLREQKILLDEGLTPDPKMSPEQQQELAQQIEKRLKELQTPEKQKSLMQGFQSKIVEWSNLVLKNEKLREDHATEQSEYLGDHLTKGRMFAHFYKRNGTYGVEKWDAANTFFSKSVDTKWVQEGDYVGRIHYMLPSEVHERWHSVLTAKEQVQILNSNSSPTPQTSSNQNGRNLGNVIRKGLYEQEFLPVEYHKREFTRSQEQIWGKPMTNLFYKDSDSGEWKTKMDFVSRTQDQPSTAYFQIAQDMRLDLDLDDNMLQVIEVYYSSYQKMYLVSWIDENGVLQTENVTDEIYREFLKDHEISITRVKSVKEFKENPEPNKAVEYYAHQYRKGLKISGGHLKEPIYRDEILDLNIKNPNNPERMLAPVCGLISPTNVTALMRNDAIQYNIVRNEMSSIIEQNIGNAIAVDMAFLPNDLREMSNEDALLYVRDLIKNLKMFPIDTSDLNVSNKGRVTGDTPIIPVMTNILANLEHLMAYAAQIRNDAYMQIGVNLQRLGGTVKYETASGNEQATTSSYSQTEVFFNTFADFQRRYYEMLLGVAQNAQETKDNHRLVYRLPDGLNDIFEFTDEDFHVRLIGVGIDDNSSSRQARSSMKQFLLNNNTILGEVLTPMQIIAAETTAEIIDIAKESVRKAELQQQQQQQHEKQLQQQQIEAAEMAKEKEREWEREKLKGEANLELAKAKINKGQDPSAYIQALTQNQQVNAQTANMQQQVMLKQAELAQRKEKDVSDNELKIRELDLKEEEIKARNKAAEAKVTVAAINP